LDTVFRVDRGESTIRHCPIEAAEASDSLWVRRHSVAPADFDKRGASGVPISTISAGYCAVSDDYK
jgi:hypothetical protein